jgi:biotin transporter BioY
VNGVRAPTGVQCRPGSHQEPLAEATRWILAGAAALYLFGAILVRVSAQPDPPLVLVHVVAFVITVLAATLVAALVCKQVVHAKRRRRDECRPALTSIDV